jgi:phage shock protein A
MTEQILQQILEKLTHLEHGQSAIENQLIAFQQFTMDKFSKIDDSFTKLDDKVTKLDGKFTKLDDKVTTLDQKVTATNLILENEIRPAIKAITEQLDDHSKILACHTQQLDRIEDKVTHHDIQISILDRTKSNRRIAKVK